MPEQTWDVFMPIILKYTRNADTVWSSEMRGWSNSGVDRLVGRSIVKMAIIAGKSLAKYQPGKYAEYFALYADSPSIIINEILLDTAIDLSAEYADMLIDWLISDSCSHMYDLSGEHDRQLDAAREIISKFSIMCTDDTFIMLENTILSYHEKDELLIVQKRFRHNHMVRAGDYSEGEYIADWAYWGMVQAYLLPALDISRTSGNTKQLICVLNRRFAGHELGEKIFKIPLETVQVPISSDISKRLSDKQWLKIINNQKLNTAEYSRKTQHRIGFTESSHSEFARLYERVGKTDPERFVSLARRFPTDVDKHYVQAVWSISALTKAPIDDIENWRPATFDSVASAARRSLSHPERDEIIMSMCFCWLVRDRADEDWSAEILERVRWLAEHYSEDNRFRNNDSDLDDYSLNSVRGSATHTLSVLLWKKYDRYQFLKPIISRLVLDKDPAIRLSILEAVIATYNIDKNQFMEWFLTLVKSDERLARYSRSVDMLFTIWQEHAEECTAIILNLFYSNDPRSSEMGAFIATNLYITFDENTELLKNMVFSKNLSSSQQEVCCKAAIALMEEQSLHNKAKSVVEWLFEYPGVIENSLNALFYRSSIMLPQDVELIKKVVASNPKESFYGLNDLMDRDDISISDYIDIVLYMCEQNTIRSNVNNIRNGGYSIVARKLLVFVNKLYERVSDNSANREKCLDMWDYLYQSDMVDANLLTRYIADI